MGQDQCSDITRHDAPQELFANMKNKNSESLTKAIWMFFMSYWIDKDLPTSTLLVLAERVEAITLIEDETRFTNYDYSFAVSNLINSAPSPINLATLLTEMDMEKFIEKVIFRAWVDRERYS